MKVRLKTPVFFSKYESMLAAFFDIPDIGTKESTQKSKTAACKKTKTKTGVSKRNANALQQVVIVKPVESRSTSLMHAEFRPLPKEKNPPQACNVTDTDLCFLEPDDEDAPSASPWWFEEANVTSCPDDTDDTDSCFTLDEEDEAATLGTTPPCAPSSMKSCDVLVKKRKHDTSGTTNIVYSGPQLCFDDDDDIF